MNSTNLDLLNEAMNQLINGYWKQVPTYSALSKLWKITFPVIFALFLLSCGRGGNNEKAPAIDTLTITSAQQDKDSIYQLKIPNDSLVFLDIIRQIESHGYKYNSTYLRVVTNSKEDVKYLPPYYFLGLERFLEDITYFRTISFDIDIIPKPRCNITQLLFSNDSLTNEYIKKFKKLNFEEPNSLLNDNYRNEYFISKNENYI